MNGNLDNASADSKIGRNKKSFQVSQNGNYREGRPNLRSSSSNALRRMSNTIITQPRFRRRPKKLNNGLTSTKSSPRSLRFEVEEEVTSESNNTSFERFCHCTSLHGWKYLSSSVNFTLRIGWIGVVIGDTNDQALQGHFLGTNETNVGFPLQRLWELRLSSWVIAAMIFCHPPCKLHRIHPGELQYNVSQAFTLIACILLVTLSF